MRPASFFTAGSQLEDISKTLQRLQEPEKPKPEPRVPTLSLGIILGLGALVIAFGWLAWPRGPSANPIGDNNAQATPTPVMSVPAPRAEVVRLNPNVPRAALVSLGAPFQPKTVQMGESFWGQMPDGRWIVATAIGRLNRWEELPWTGNRIGDARWIGKHCYVWLNPIGQTYPTWIDP